MDPSGALVVNDVCPGLILDIEINETVQSFDIDDIRLKRIAPEAELAVSAGDAADSNDDFQQKQGEYQTRAYHQYVRKYSSHRIKPARRQSRAFQDPERERKGNRTYRNHMMD